MASSIAPVSSAPQPRISAYGHHFAERPLSPDALSSPQDMASEPPLTSSPSSRPTGLPSTVSSSPQTTCLPLNAAIFSPVHPSYYHHLRQHAGSVLSSSPTARSNSSGPLVPKPPSNNDITNSLTRPRTSNQVFSSTSDLAAHHGIPTTFPPLPKLLTIQSHLAESVTQPEVSDFHALKDSYLNMLSQKSDSTPALPSAEMHSATVSPADLQQPIAADFDLEGILRDLGDSSSSPSAPSITYLQISAQGVVADPDMSPFEPNDFLTSPWTPSLDNFGESPGETPLNDFLSTPLIAQNDVLFSGPLDMPLFGPGMIDDESSKAPVLDTSSLLTMSPTSPSLNTPALDPAHLLSPALAMDNTSFSPSTLSQPPDQVSSSASETARRRVSATGTRKNISTDSLVPLDAPTQARRYLTPSVTSRKEMPAVFARKRARQQMLEGEDDELEMESLKPNATELEQIEWKRRQNTLAARKSRKRKLMHQQGLENQVSELTNDREKWKQRALTLQGILQANGIPFTEFQD